MLRSRHPAPGRKFRLYAATVANVGIAVTKFVAASVTGSASIFSQAIGDAVKWVERALHELHPEVSRISIRLI